MSMMTSSMEIFSALLALCAGNSPHKRQWGGVLMFSLICASINAWANNREAVALIMTYYLISSHLISSHLISSYLILSHIILSYLILSYLIIVMRIFVNQFSSHQPSWILKHFVKTQLFWAFLITFRNKFHSYIFGVNVVNLWHFEADTFLFSASGILKLTSSYFLTKAAKKLVAILALESFADG